MKYFIFAATVILEFFSVSAQATDTNLAFPSGAYDLLPAENSETCPKEMYLTNENTDLIMDGADGTPLLHVQLDQMNLSGGYTIKVTTNTQGERHRRVFKTAIEDNGNRFWMLSRKISKLAFLPDVDITNDDEEVFVEKVESTMPLVELQQKAEADKKAGKDNSLELRYLDLLMHHEWVLSFQKSIMANRTSGGGTELEHYSCLYVQFKYGHSTPTPSPTK